MTSVLPDVDELQHLEFDAELPCEVDHYQCPRIAEWRVQVHCVQCLRVVVMLYCQHDTDRLLHYARRRQLYDSFCAGSPEVVLDSCERIR